MKSYETPLHKVQGMGASHSGTGHFWRQRITAAALVPLLLWFAYAMLGLAGASEVTVIGFLARPWNAILMATFATTALYHMNLGIQVVLDDYVHGPGMRIALALLARITAILIWATCIWALLQIASL